MTGGQPTSTESVKIVELEELYSSFVTLNSITKDILDIYRAIKRAKISDDTKNKLNKAMLELCRVMNLWFNKFKNDIRLFEVYLYRSIRECCGENIESCREKFKQLRNNAKECVKEFVELLKILSQVESKKNVESAKRAKELLEKFESTYKEFTKEYNKFFRGYRKWNETRIKQFNIKEFIEDEEKLDTAINYMERYIVLLYNLLKTAQYLFEKLNAIQGKLLSSRNPEEYIKNIQMYSRELSENIYIFINQLKELIKYEEHVACAMRIIAILSSEYEDIFENILPEIKRSLEYLEHKEALKEFKSSLDKLRKKFE